MAYAYGCFGIAFVVPCRMPPAGQLPSAGRTSSVTASWVQTAWCCPSRRAAPPSCESLRLFTTTAKDSPLPPLLVPRLWYNNACENAIRPFVLGRKNWLFCKSPEGAENSCGIYSLIGTAKQNGLIPLHYLTTLFEKAPVAISPDDWEKLLPWNIFNP